jgi:tetratricopeptide (TPR) repeat protein
MQGEAAQTQSGIPVGTPSYMAPEQARGQTRAIGPAVDVYALGAILYELLTGRPPFRGETAAATLQEVITRDPVPPTRLNSTVPRDLDTICLKCLHKEPGQRYASAAALADDLRRFGEGRPIQARPLGWGARSWRWCRRNPMAAALVATGLVLVGLASGGGVWLVRQRADRQAEAARHDAELHSEIATAVAQAASFRQGFHFREARELLEQARQRLEPAGPGDLRRRVDQALAGLDLVQRLDAAQLRTLTLVDRQFDFARAERLIAAAFAEAGLGQKGDDIEATAAAVRASAVSAELVAALDECAGLTADIERREWLLAVARKVDPDPARDHLRQLALRQDPELWRDRDRLAQLARELRVAESSPQLVVTLARIARQNRGDGLALLTAAHAQFPQDFWLNFELSADLFWSQQYEESLGYCRTAVALRPQSGQAYNNLGATLYALGRVDEAIDQLQRSLELGPKLAAAHGNLGGALHNKGRLDEAIDHLQQALKIDPMFVAAHINLGAALYSKGRLDEAINHYQQALKIDPTAARAHASLGEVLRAKGRPEEAIDHLQQAVRLDPNSAVAHNNLGFALRSKGQLDEAINHYQQALKIDPKYAAAYCNLGGALHARGRLDEAIDQCQQALKIDPKFVVAHLNLADVLRHKGRLEEAIDHLQEAVRINPRYAFALTALGITLYDAARASAQTAAGQGPAKAPPGEPERTALRRKALGWLREDLEMTTKLVSAGKVMGLSLSHWQADPALASVRDPAELAKLPAAEREEWQRLWADVAALVAADPLEQGRARAGRRDWAQAADPYARVLRRGLTEDGGFWFEYAALLLLSGDRPGYAKACAHMIEACGKDGGPDPYLVARACTLAPDAVAETSRPGRLAEKALQAAARQFWSLTEQGALAYRAGRFQEAAPLFEQSLRANPRPGAAVVNWLWLALTNHRLDKAEEARHWLVKAQAWLDQYRDGMPADAEQVVGLGLHNWLEAHILRREAEALFQPTGRQGGTENRERGSPPK